MKQFIFENILNSNIEIRIKAFRLSQAEEMLKAEVKDEEIKTDSWDSFPELSMQDGTNRFSFSLGAKSTRSVSKTKLEKLIG